MKRSMCIFDGGEALQGNTLLYLMQMGLHDVSPPKKLCLLSAFVKGWGLALLMKGSRPVAAVCCDSVSVYRVLLPPFQPAFALLYNGQGGSGLSTAVTVPGDVTLAWVENCYGCIPFLLLWKYSLGEPLIGVVRASVQAELLLFSCVLQRIEEGRNLQPQ